MKCRHCDTELEHRFVDLGSSPPSNSYLSDAMMKAPEKWYPLKVLVCHHCWLVQTEDFVGASEMFSDDYAYFSSFSSSWLQHARNYVDMMIRRFHLHEQSCVVEIAANDGYLLQFVKHNNIPCYGIEPTHGTAEAAREKGLEIVEEFFGEQQAKELVSQNKRADLLVANNVLAHVPDINDFIKGFTVLLKKDGVVTFEFPHLLNLVKYNQFDTIYHEHYSYLSLISVQSILEKNGLNVFDVEELTTHGGSLRVYAQSSETGKQAISENVEALLTQETIAGLNRLDFYTGFQAKIETIKLDFVDFLIQAKRAGKQVAAYGAAAKGNTMMNFSGVHADLIAFVVDKNPAKQGKYMPGSRIPIKDEQYLKDNQVDYVVIFPWNLKNEIIAQLDYIKRDGKQFVLAIPELELL
ncbi:class I SAM-dependent methyltransferase [sulfur-oxidizing endosymbiont of Gigantopelta aegis]|uniref:class I SAM-dependent methyltransferase n=1 Tax=sulfur-oxidizing endosymbiont of Gigantopelta aegis TaxID=2794934 RepID=UPI0018DD8AC2|nr:class I SAM-dependent methyltransferase [sulfur-oxidizing endosymbiont of Gigantopelta aegis]